MSQWAKVSVWCGYQRLHALVLYHWKYEHTHAPAHTPCTMVENPRIPWRVQPIGMVCSAQASLGLRPVCNSLTPLCLGLQMCDEEQGQASVHWARAEVLQQTNARLDKRIASGKSKAVTEQVWLVHLKFGLKSHWNAPSPSCLRPTLRDRTFECVRPSPCHTICPACALTDSMLSQPACSHRSARSCWTDSWRNTLCRLGSWGRRRS